MHAVTLADMSTCRAKVDMAEDGRLAATSHRPLEVDVNLYPDAACSQITAVAFVSPDWQCIAGGLPPITRCALLPGPSILSTTFTTDRLNNALNPKG